MNVIVPCLVGLSLGVLGCRTPVNPKVSAPDADPTAEWNASLAAIVTDDGLVDYDVLTDRREALDRYVAWLALPRPHIAPSQSRHAFWINAYNALVLYGVLENDRPASVLDVDGWLPTPGSGFFVEQAFLVDGHRISLWEIEHERLRERLLDYRDHAALNCASKSCPPLRAGVYESRGLEQQLDEQMARWVMDANRGVRLEDDVAVFSPIFDWFARDFDLWTGGDDLCLTASRFAEGAQRKALRRLSARGCPHRFASYDWTLNQAE